MRYSVVFGYANQGVECDIEPTFCTNSYCSHPCNTCGFTFEHAKNMVLTHYSEKLKRLESMNEEDWINC